MLEISLNKEDIKLLKTIKTIESSASFGSGISTFGPVLTLFSGNPLTFAFSFLTADWKSHFEGGSSIQTIAACTIVELLGGHEENVDGVKLTFFETLRESYEKKC